MTEFFNLTAEQTAVAETSTDAHMLVTAGPGTGKTHTLMARLGWLVDHEGLAPRDILVLSFTRSAVGEVKRRLSDAGSDARAVSPITLDSLASRMLRETSTDDLWAQKSFDGRIEAAIAEIDRGMGLIHDVQVICIDEIQDLVGIRAEFVREILKHSSAGVSLFGDPAQGIYNFSLPDEADIDEVGSPALYAWLRSHYGENLEEKQLTQNHRARSEQAKAALTIGEPLRDPDADYEDPWNDLCEVVVEATAIPALPSLGRTPNVVTGLLCRNNGQALAASRELRSAGVDHVVRRGAADRCVAPWVAGVIRNSDTTTLSENLFKRCFASIEPTPEVPADEAWKLLRRTARDDLGVDMDRLRTNLMIGNVPDELATPQTSNLVVSTIHRSKGLEYDRVVLLDQKLVNAEFDETGEEARTLFVALTRARDEIYALPWKPESNRRLFLNREIDRWTEREFGRDWARHAIEFKSVDVDQTHPPGSSVVRGDSIAIQDLLSKQVAIGDEVELTFVRAMAHDPTVGTYRIDWQGQLIGITAETFGRDLFAELKVNRGWEVRWPEAITGVHIDGIESVGGNANVTNASGLGTGGAWVSPRLVGLGTLMFKSNEQ